MEEEWGKVEDRIRLSEGVVILLRRERALRVKEHPMTTKRAIIISIKDNEGNIVVLANVYVESGDEERRNDVWKEVTREITKIKKNSRK
jgi:hypothetical protein